MGDMRLAVVGAAGRMGRTLIRLIAGSAGVRLAAAVERADAAEIGTDAGALAGLGGLDVTVSDNPAVAFAGADAVIDFTTPAATVAFAAAAAEAGIVHIIGTTGLSPDDEAAIAGAARRIPIVKSGNMSLGVNLLAGLVRQAARALDDSFDIEIVEIHHRYKVDAPSGTALLLGREAAAGRGIDLDTRAVRARDGETGPRRPGDIGFAALRGGSVVGEHAVLFAGEGEVVSLSHQALDRAIFGRGAIRAALWARGRAPGLYSMADVLNLPA